MKSKPPYALILLQLLAIGVVGYSVYAYGFLEPGRTVSPSMRAVFREHRLGILLHVFGSCVALLLGPMQFTSRLRAKHLALHKILGALYLIIGVGVGGLAGLFMSLHASGGILAKLGFGSLALAWLSTAVLGLRHARSHQYVIHGQWMVRNYALTFAAVTLRVLLPSSFALDIPFDIAYPAISWLCWVPNLLFAEWLIRRSTPRRSSS